MLRGGRISKEFQGLGISRKIGVYNIRAILNSKHKHIVGVGGAHVDAVKRIIEMGVVKNVLQMVRIEGGSLLLKLDSDASGAGTPFIYFSSKKIRHIRILFSAKYIPIHIVFHINLN